MAIEPDTKDWTWVLGKTCPECGFDSSTTDERDVAGLLRENAAAWPAVLERPDVRVRPDDHTWSPLEYAAHVRDVFRLFAVRLDLMLTQDDPIYPNWDQDETAIAEKYNEQDPRVVATELVAAGSELADAFDAVPPEAWSRPGRRGDGAKFTIATFARYLIHDPVHHLWDVRK
ncbi:MAG TPA: DinB family protein [Terrimesophilobacter sp.]|nr:DinB family protein [Terrimesophilobacter sp.]